MPKMTLIEWLVIASIVGIVGVIVLRAVGVIH